MTSPKTALHKYLTDKSSLLLYVVIFCFVMTVAYLGFHNFLEDAYMHLRYAENSYDAGRWSVWNLDEQPISGESSPLWLLLLLASKYLGCEPYLASKAIGAISLLVIYFAAFSSYLQKSERTGIAFDLLFLAQLFLLIPFLSYAISGMETLPFLALLLLLTMSQTVPVFWLFSVLIIFIRPEACVFVFIAAIVKFKKVSTIARAGLPSFALFLIYLTWHYTYFGYIFPNAYYAKHQLPVIHALYRGTRYIYSFVVSNYTILLLGLVYFISAKKDELDKMTIWYSVFSICFVLLVGGDSNAFPYHRLFLPIVIFFALYSFLTISRYARTAGHPILCLSVLLLLTVFPLVSEAVENNRQFLKQVALRAVDTRLTNARDHQLASTNYDVLAHAPARSWVATSRAGKLPASFPNINFIDILGLNDVYLAHHGKRYHIAGDGKSDAEYILKRSPDFIELVTGAAEFLRGFTQIKAISGVTYLSPTDEEICTLPAFRENYLLIPTGDRALFIHKKAISTRSCRDSRSIH